jgi:hypothetical protein
MRRRDESKCTAPVVHLRHGAYEAFSRRLRR